MPETQYTIVNGKRRQCLIIRGMEYVRKGYSLSIPDCEAFEKRCDFWGWDESKLIERIVKELLTSTGVNDERVRQAGDLYDRTGDSQIKEAVGKTRKKLFPWLFNTN